MLKTLAGLVPLRPRVNQAGLLTQSELELAIRKERSRCDRHHIQFSLIAMVLQTESHLRERKLGILQQILGERLRLTDEKGYLGDGRIGILLPHTDREGALVVLNSIHDAAVDEQVRFLADVSTYPSDFDSAVRGTDLEQQEDGDDHADMEGVAPVTRRASDDTTFQGALRMHPTYHGGYPFWKRSMDIVGSIVGLVLAAPILAVACIGIKATSHGPILYKQLRTGYRGRQFWIYKLRTMVVDADDQKSALMESNERDGPAFKMQNDPRITSIGKVLRALALDELPQLWNVLKGDMALVGPRPLPCSEADSCTAWQWHRHDSKPGLTCTWQIAKSRKISFDDWMRMDLRYGARPSFLRDLRLIGATIVAMVLGRVEH